MSQPNSITSPDEWRVFLGFSHWDMDIEVYRHGAWNYFSDVIQRAQFPYTVYLIHLDEPLCSYRPARHYLGSSIAVDKRLVMHALGYGSAIMRAVTERGISWRVARTWQSESRELEGILKRTKNLPRFCPICKLERFTSQYFPTPLSTLFVSQEQLSLTPNL